MEINFKGPVMPIDPYSQLAFVEILNILLTAGTHRGREPLPHKQEGQSAVRFAVRLFQMVVRRRTILPCGNARTTIQRYVLTTGYIDLPFGVLAAKDSGKDKGNGKLKMKRYGNYGKNTQPGNRARGI